MMHQNFPTDARRAASHCGELLRPSEPPSEIGPEFERFGARLAAALTQCMGEAANDPEVRVTALGVDTLATDQFAGHCAQLAALSVHRFGVAGHALCLALDGGLLLSLLDRTFGGSGKVAGQLPAVLPPTARLMSRRIEQRVVAAVAAELGGLEFRTDEDGAGGTTRAPFAPDTELTALAIEVAAESGQSWRHVIAVESAALTSLLPKRASAPRTAVSRRKPGVTEAPFADLPLAASARLVDMAMPLHRLASIEPGTVLPIIVSRSVPLQVGEIVLARGTVGEVDDQVALQISHTFIRKEL